MNPLTILTYHIPDLQAGAFTSTFNRFYKML